MNFNKKYIFILLIFLLSFLFVYSKIIDKNDKVIKNDVHFNLDDGIGIPLDPEIIDTTKLSPESNPIGPTIEDRRRLAAAVADKNDLNKLKELYENKELLASSYNEFFMPFDTHNKEKETNIIYLLEGGAHPDDLKYNYYLMNGYIYENGEFYQCLRKKINNKLEDFYVKGKFTSDEIQLIKSIYHKAYEDKKIIYK